MNEQKQTIITILDYIDKLTSDIRGDWNDPRSQCREIWEAVSRAKEFLGEKIEKPYRHLTDSPFEEWIKKIKELT